MTLIKWFEDKIGITYAHNKKEANEHFKAIFGTDITNKEFDVSRVFSNWPKLEQKKDTDILNSNMFEKNPEKIAKIFEHANWVLSEMKQSGVVFDVVRLNELARGITINTGYKGKEHPFRSFIESDNDLNYFYGFSKKTDQPVIN